MTERIRIGLTERFRRLVGNDDCPGRGVAVDRVGDGGSDQSNAGRADAPGKFRSETRLSRHLRLEFSAAIFPTGGRSGRKNRHGGANNFWMVSASFARSSAKVSRFCGWTRFGRCIALMPDGVLSTYVVCWSGSSWPVRLRH